MAARAGTLGPNHRLRPGTAHSFQRLFASWVECACLGQLGRGGGRRGGGEEWAGGEERREEGERREDKEEEEGAER